MNNPIGNYLGGEIISLALCVPLAFLLVYGFKRWLSDHAAMGLVVTLFLPAFGHLYIPRRAWWYVLGVLALEGVSLYVFNSVVSRVLGTVVSLALMYRRLQAEPGGLAPGEARSYGLRVALNSEELAWVQDKADELDVQPGEVLRVALREWRERREAEEQGA